MKRRRFPANGAVASPPPVLPPLVENDFGHIKGQEASKRAVMVALAGRHFAILVGPAGNGKTILIQAAKAIDPQFQAKEVTIWNRLNDNPRQRDRHLEPLSRLPADLHIEVPWLPFHEWMNPRRGTDTAVVRQTVERARAFAAGHDDLTLGEGCLLLAKQAYQETGPDTPRLGCRHPRGQDHCQHVRVGAYPGTAFGRSGAVPPV